MCGEGLGVDRAACAFVLGPSAIPSLRECGGVGRQFGLDYGGVPSMSRFATKHKYSGLGFFFGVGSFCQLVQMRQWEYQIDFSGYQAS